MKSTLILVIATVFFALNCQAKCDCDETDNACISQCVIEANSCVTHCRGNIECYEDCIDDKWPTQEEIPDIPDYYNEVLGSSNNSAAATVTTTLISTNSPSASISPSSTASVKMADATHTSTGNTYNIPHLTFIFALLIAYISQ